MGDDEAMTALADDLSEDDLLLGRIEVVRYLAPDGEDIVVFRAVDAGGDDLPLVEVMGMLRLTEDTAIRDRMGEA